MKKQVDIIMLPTEKRSIIGYSNIYNKLMFCEEKFFEDFNGILYNLYLLSNDDIKDEEWCYDIKNKLIYQYKQGNNEKWNISILQQLKKIIATTDESLGLPRPSNEFLKKFCELDGIWKVLVEYEKETYNARFTDTKNGIGNPDTWGKRYNLKVAPDNTITINFI